MSTKVIDHAFVPCDCEIPTNHSRPYCHRASAADEKHPLWRSVCAGYEEEHLPATNEHGQCILAFGHLGLCRDGVGRTWGYAHQAPKVVAQPTVTAEAIRTVEHQGMDAQAQANLSRASIMLEQKQRELDLAIEAKEAAEADLLQANLVKQSMARRIEYLEKDTRELQAIKKTLRDQISGLTVRVKVLQDERDAARAELGVMRDREDALGAKGTSPEEIGARWALHQVQMTVFGTLKDCHCEDCTEGRRESR
jgi:hypothetical protein